MKLSLTFGGAGTVQASAESRVLAGELVRYGVLGRTSRGPLRVRAGALRFPDDLTRVKLTREHDRAASRGYCKDLEFSDTGIRASAKVSDGPEGDAAIQEAVDHTRDAFSFDVVDATVVGDEITDALVIAIGQVGIPAYDDARIDSIAASTTGRNTMKLAPEQAALLVELKAKDNPSDAEKEVIKALEDLAAAPDVAPPPPAAPVAAAAPAPVAASQQIAASIPALPGAAVPGLPTSSTKATPQGGAFGKFCVDMAAAMNPENPTKVADITAALQDITYSAHADVIQQPEWSGELWSGLEYDAEFDDVFVKGPMTALKGVGWRFTTKLEIADYAGDKAAIPSDNITTEDTEWAGARLAVGADIDRAFFDFPTPGFIESLFQQVRESTKIKFDAKKKAYLSAHAVPAAEDEWAGVPVVLDPQTTLLKAVAVAVRALKRRRVGRPDWVYVSDEDMFTLLDVDVTQVLAYLKLFGVDPEQFRATSQLPAGTVIAGVQKAAKWREFPASPFRVQAEHLANGGVDQAFFAYWAIEEHHDRGIASAEFDPEFVPA